ncbi:hypothetical protein E3A20_25260, partial [Planctomyces bekefii]
MRGREKMPSSKKLSATNGESLDGAELYLQTCSGCHGAIEVSTKRNRSAEAIGFAITAVPAMKDRDDLLALSQVQITAIAKALSDSLSSDAVPEETVSRTGAEIYAASCAGCHRPLSASTVRNKSSNQIKGALANVSAMAAVAPLTDLEIDALAAALSDPTVTPIPSGSLVGAEIYANSCSGCHLPLQNTTKSNRTAAVISNAIAMIPTMSQLGSLQ